MLVLVSLAACGNVVRGNHSARLFSVVTSIHADAGGSVCVSDAFGSSNSSDATQLPTPVICLVPLKGITATALPKSAIHPDGSFETDPLQLIGKWDGSSLTLTSQPRPAPSHKPSGYTTVWATDAASTDEVRGGQPTTDGMEDQKRLTIADPQLRTKGIILISWGFDRIGLTVLVVAADQADASYLHSNFDVAKVSSWFTPIP